MHLVAAVHALLAACVASAAANPKNPKSEEVSIKDFAAQIVSSAGTSKMGIKFTLDGLDAHGLECAADDVAMWHSKDHRCGDSEYKFAVFTSADVLTFMVRIYHRLGPDVQYWGQDQVPTHCGVPPGSHVLVCSQEGAVTLRIDDAFPAPSNE